MRVFLNTPGNGLFAGGLIFALGLHLGGEKRDLLKNWNFNVNEDLLLFSSWTRAGGDCLHTR